MEHSTISWRAIFGGTFITLLFYFILMSLGLAIGGASLQAIIEGGTDGGALSIGSCVWLIVSALISLFVGSWFAGRVSGPVPQRIGAVQGMVISALFFGFLISQIGATVGLLGRGLESTVNLAQSPQVQDTVEKALGGLNLKAPPDQVLQGVATRLLRGDDEGAKRYLARQAGIGTNEATRRIKAMKTDIEKTVRDVGSKVAKATSVAGWTFFGAMFLGTVAAVFGGGGGAATNLRRPLSRGDQERFEERKRRAA